MLHNSSGAFSRKTPKHTNPANYSLPPRQPIDNLIDPKLTSDDVAVGNLDNLYISPVAGFRNTSYDLSWRTYQDLAEHANWHVENNTFGGGEDGYRRLFIHQELMYEGLLAGMSFLESHEFSLKRNPIPTK